MKFECPDVNSFDSTAWDRFRDLTSKDESFESTFLIGSQEEEVTYNQPILRECTRLQENTLELAVLRSSDGTERVMTQEDFAELGVTISIEEGKVKIAATD